jgi:hypothetical protein
MTTTTIETRHCPKSSGGCGQDLPLSDYYLSCTDPRCKKCFNEYRRVRTFAKNPKRWHTVEGDTAPKYKVIPGVPDKTLLHGIAVPEQVEAPLDQGMWCWRNEKGWRVIALHHTADPDKRPDNLVGQDWIKQAKKATPSERDWRREYDLDFTISAGEPFFTTFNRAVHVRPCKYDKSLPLLRGWDFGRAHPACVWSQLGRDGVLRVLYSYMGTNINIFKFAPLVVSETNARFPGAKPITDYGDPAGAQETDKGSSTSVLFLQFGILINHRYSYIEEGLKMIDQKLLVQEDGSPGILIDPINTDLIDGFAGGYELDSQAIAKTDNVKLLSRPKKDGYFDHLMDALRYTFVNLFTMLDKDPKDAPALSSVSLWRTNEQNREVKDAKHLNVFDEAYG